MRVEPGDGAWIQGLGPEDLIFLSAWNPLNLDYAEQQINLTTDLTDLRGYRKNSGRNSDLNLFTRQVNSYRIEFT